MIFAGPHVLLPADKARHVGEAVAMVVADTSAQAETRAHPRGPHFDMMLSKDLGANTP